VNSSCFSIDRWKTCSFGFVVLGTELFRVMQLWPITFGALIILSASVVFLTLLKHFWIRYVHKPFLMVLDVGLELF